MDCCPHTFDSEYLDQFGLWIMRGNNASGYYVEAHQQWREHTSSSMAARRPIDSRAIPGNNYGICSFYSCQQYVGGRATSSFDPSLTLMNFHASRAISAMAAGVAITVHVASVQYICSPLRSGPAMPGNARVRFATTRCRRNCRHGHSVGATGQTYGALWAYRNNCRANHGILVLVQGRGPITSSNQTPLKGRLRSHRSSVRLDGLNIFQRFGASRCHHWSISLRLSRLHVGTIGAQIA